jgi:sugar/nucleoside kinase (ribokinase family)
MTSETLHLDYLVIGHVTRDITTAGPRIGGTAAYASLTANALGQRVGVVTSTAPDLDLSPLGALELAVSPSPATTTFENRYTASGRSQILHERAGPLDEEDVPKAWLRPSIVHLAPVADELPMSLTACFPDSMVGASTQGWLRGWDADGRVDKVGWRRLLPLLSETDVVVCSTEDLKGGLDDAEAMAPHCRLLVVTDGPNGAYVYWQEASRHFPTTAAQEIDPTGAGDVFAAAFLTRYAQTGNPWGAAKFANHLATASIERLGVQSVPTALEVAGALSMVRP